MISDKLQKASPAIYLILVVIAASGMGYTLRAGRARSAAEAHFAAFASQMANAQYAEAQKSIDAALALWPDNAYYRSSSGVLYERLATLGGVASFLKPDRPVTPEARGLLELAVGAYQEALARNPDDDCFYHNLGWLYWRLGQKEASVDSFKQAITLNRAVGLYHLSLGLVYEQSGDPQAAEPEYVSALRMSPALLDSDFFRDLQDRQPSLAGRIVSNAISELEKRLGAADDPILESYLGRLYIGSNLNRAHELLVRATTGLPNLSRAWTNLGNVLVLEGNAGEAELCYRKATLLDQSDYLPLKSLGSVYEQDSKPKPGIDCYLKAIDNWRQMISVHAYRSARIYNSQVVLRDDIVPGGLLAYTEPDFDPALVYGRVSALYGQIGDASKAAYFQQRSRQPIVIP